MFEYIRRCVSFRKDVSNVFLKFVLKVFVECGLKSRQAFLQVDQVTKSRLPLLYSKVFLMS